MSSILTMLGYSVGVCAFATLTPNQQIGGATPLLDKPIDVEPVDVKYVGALSCSSCHQEIYNDWLESAHAKSMKEIQRSSQHQRCLACHVTDAFSMEDQAVGCEACHGPGSVYSHEDVMRNGELAHLVGLKKITTAYWDDTCGECHGEDSGEENFDGRAAWSKIAHPQIFNKKNRYN